MDLRSIAAPILAELATTIDETLHLAQLEGGCIRYIAGAESERALRVADRTGQIFRRTARRPARRSSPTWRRPSSTRC